MAKTVAFCTLTLAALLFLLSVNGPRDLPPIGSRVFMTADGDLGPLFWKVVAYEKDRAWITSSDRGMSIPAADLR